MRSSVPVGGRDVRFGEGGTGAGVGAGFGHGDKPTWTSAPRRRGTPARCRGPISLSEAQEMHWIPAFNYTFVIQEPLLLM